MDDQQQPEIDSKSNIQLVPSSIDEPSDIILIDDD
jgi:hypothetical protein